MGNSNPQKPLKRIPAHYAPAVRKCLGLGCSVRFKTPAPGVRFCPRCVRRLHDANPSRTDTMGPLKDGRK